MSFFHSFYRKSLKYVNYSLNNTLNFTKVMNKGIPETIYSTMYGKATKLYFNHHIMSKRRNVMKAVKRLLSILLCTLMVFGVEIIGFEGFKELLIQAKASSTKYNVGDTIDYGTYPQTEVKDQSLIDTLNSIESQWISYSYYSGTGTMYNGQMNESDFMKYRDVFFNNKKYRGVMFTCYRPIDTGFKLEYTNTVDQYKNGYNKINTVYWFEYEPIKWRILSSSNGLIMTENIIDSQPYNNFVIGETQDLGIFSNKEKTWYANDYYHSSIRQWLISDFYNASFTFTQKNNIKLTNLNNNAYSSTILSNYSFAQSNDKVFLLSYFDVNNTEYGFPNSLSASRTRSTEGTDYAKCQGLWVSLNKTSRWSLRTPGSYCDYQCDVDDWGAVKHDSGHLFRASSTREGIRPAMCLSELKSDTTIEISQGNTDNGFKFDKDVYSLQKGDTLNLTPDFCLPKEEAKEFIWHTSDPNVVKVDSNEKYSGIVTAHNPGQALITVYSARFGYSESVIVAVEKKSLIICEGERNGDETKYYVSLVDVDNISKSGVKGIKIDKLSATNEELSNITVAVTDSSIVSIKSIKKENGCLAITMKDKGTGFTYVSVTYNPTGEVKYFPVFSPIKNNLTLGIDEIPEKQIKNRGKYNFTEQGIIVYDFISKDLTDGGKEISFNAYNKSCSIGSVDVHAANGDIIKSIMISNYKGDNPVSLSDNISKLWKLVKAVVNLDINDDTLWSNKTAIKTTLPKGGYLSITNDISASTSCFVYNTVSIAVEAVGKTIAGFSNLNSNQKEEVTESIAQKVTEKILSALKMDSKSKIVSNLMKKLSSNMLKSADKFDSEDFFSVFYELCQNLEINFIDLLFPALKDFLIDLTTDLLLSHIGLYGGLVKGLYKISGWMSFMSFIDDIKGYSGSGSTFIYNIQTGNRRVSNGIIYDGEIGDKTIFRTFEMVNGDLFEELAAENDRVKLYDICLVRNNELIQPTSTVKIYIPIPSNWNHDNLTIYHIEKSGNKSKVTNTKIEGDYLVFETNHFSCYAIIEESQPGAPNYTLILDKTELQIESGEKTTVLCSYTYTGEKVNFYIRWETADVLVANGTWGTWNEGVIPLTINAKDPGNTTITVKLINKATDELLASKTINVIVTQSGYILTYNANGGTGVPSAQSTSTGSITLSTVKPIRSGYDFNGWAKSSAAVKADYQPGDTITITGNTTLYAVWSAKVQSDSQPSLFVRILSIIFFPITLLVTLFGLIFSL